jgi:hypothetical protein
MGLLMGYLCMRLGTTNIGEVIVAVDLGPDRQDGFRMQTIPGECEGVLM